MKSCSVIVCHFAQVDEFENKEISRSETMKESVTSLFENTDYPAEIIVIDNGGNPDDSDWLLQKSREGKINIYVRYKENMKFGFSWNQGLRLATGDYLCFTCNDLKYEKGWLSQLVGLLEKYPERKLLAAPYITPDKNRPNFNKEVLEDGTRINSMAGSNCFVTTRETYLEIGEMPHHRVGGSIWWRVMVRHGYLVIIPKEDVASHIAYRQGVNWKRPIKVESTLLNGDKVNFNYNYANNKLFKGKQKSAGIPLL